MEKLEKSGLGASLKTYAMLISTAVFWGTGFIATKIAIDDGVSVGFLLMFRFLAAALIFGILMLKKLTTAKKSEFLWGILLGVLLFAAFYLQTAGIRYTTPSNNALLTASGVVYVPFFQWISYRKRPHPSAFASVFICFLGVATLSGVTNGLSFRLGDFLTLGCAVIYSVHTVIMENLSKKGSLVAFTWMQFLTAGILSGAAFLAFERTAPPHLISPGMASLAYLCVFCTVIAYFFQASTLRKISPTRATLILSGESVFGALLSVLFGFEPFSWKLLIGGALVVFSVMLSELGTLKRVARLEGGSHA